MLNKNGKLRHIRKRELQILEEFLLQKKETIKGLIPYFAVGLFNTIMFRTLLRQSMFVQRFFDYAFDQLRVALNTRRRQ